jgi:hypothetical protein
MKDKKKFFGIGWLFALGIIIILIGALFYFELQNYIDECKFVIDQTDNDLLFNFENSCQWMVNFQMIMGILSIVGVVLTTLGIILPKN